MDDVIQSLFELRYYQTEAVAAVYREWDRVQSTAVISATGTGKTEMYLSIGTSYPGRVLVIAHRDYLLNQPINRLRSKGFTDVDIEKAELRSEGRLVGAKMVFASVQSLCRAERLATFDPFAFSVVIIDEGHRATAKSYRTILDHFKRNPRLRILILTATPKRKDGIALGTVCDSVAYVFGPKTAIEEGWIVPLRFYRREVKGLDFSTVKLKGTDLDQEQVEQLLMQEEPLHRVCASLAEDRGPTLIFCPGVLIARAYYTLMNKRYRNDRAEVLWAESDDKKREEVGKKLANGDIDYLFNCDIATEGYDVPELVRVVWAAPTASLVKFTQGTGRVFRPHSSLRTALTGDRDNAETRRLQIQQSPKPIGMVVTYYPQNCAHQLCEPNDILGGEDLDPKVKTYAKQIQEITAAQDGGSDPDKDIESAEAIVELRALLEKRRDRIRAQAKTEDTEYDAFGGSRNRSKAEGAKQEKAAAKGISGDWPPGDPPSDKMIGWFKYKGVDAVGLGMSKSRAYVIRQLVGEHGVSMPTALGYSNKQARGVLASYEKKAVNNGDAN